MYVQYNDTQHTRTTNVRNRHNTLNNNIAHYYQQRTGKEKKKNKYTLRYIHNSTIQKYGINPTFAHLRK